MTHDPHDDHDIRMEDFHCRQGLRLTRLEDNQAEMRDNLNAVGDVVLGTRRSEFEGGGRNEDGLKHMLVNGGVPAKVSLQSFDRNTKLIAAAILSAGPIIGGLVVKVVS